MDAELDRMLSSAKNVRDLIDKQWLINLAFYAGNQWVQFNPMSRSLEKPKVPSYRVLLVSNQVQPTVRTEAGKITANKPKFFVVPSSDDADDIKKAKVSEMLLEHHWYNLNLHDKFVDGAYWACIAGNAFAKVYWDSSAGTMIDIPQTDEMGQQAVDELGQPVYVKGHIGEVAVDIVSPFELYIDPLATSIDNAAWVIHVKVRSKEYVKTRFGVDAQEQELSTSEYYQGNIPNGDYIGTKSRKGVVIRELWMVPTSDYPEGRFAVWVGDDKVIDGSHPYDHKKLPITHMKHIVMPGSLYGDSVVTQLIPVQIEYNKTRSQIIENKNLMSKPKWMIPYGSIDQDITSMPGENVVYKNGLKPQAWTPPSIPQYVVDECTRDIEDFNRISGINDVSRGQVPPNLRSGVAISFLQEQDNSRLGTTTKSYENFIAATGKQILSLCAQFYTEPRVIRVVGEDRQVDVKEIMGHDFFDTYDVRVLAGSSLPESKAAKQDFLMQLWQYKVVDDAKLMLKLLDLGGFEGAMDTFEADFHQVDRENDKMTQGMALMANDFDNHIIHLSEHNKYRKTVQYEQLPDNIKQIFMIHCQQHKQFMQTEMAFQQMTIPAGQPGGPQQPPPAGQVM